MTKNLMSDSSEKAAESFRRAEAEVKASPHYSDLLERDLDATVLRSDYWAYKLENAIAADPNVRFRLLILLSTVLCVLLATAWSSVVDPGGPQKATGDFWSAVFMGFQVLITGGYTSSILKLDERLIFVSMIVVGVTLVSILIGLITDFVNGYMESLSVGSTKVVEKGHTLILGWNEATVRVICQIAFLRRGFQMQNETSVRRWLRYGRVQPSTPVAVAQVVVMTDLKEKDEMTKVVAASFSSRHIDPRRTKLGRDIVFRKGDPCDNHDLVRVAAQKARHVIVMMTAKDELEASGNPGTAPNSATTRTMLALRNVIFSHGRQLADTFQEGLVCVVQLPRACPYLSSVDLLATDGHDCLYPQDLNRFINSLLFACCTKPGMSRVLLDLMDFEGTALRCRKPRQLRGGPRNQAGWFVGKPMRQCMLEHGWANGVLIGCDDARLNTPLKSRGSVLARGGGKGGSSGGGGGGVDNDEPGLVSSPERIVREDDFLVFVSPSSTPTVSDLASDRQDFAKEAKPFLHLATTGKGPENPQPVKVLVCGWRREWTLEPSRIHDRLSSIVQSISLKKGSSVTVFNLLPTDDFDELLESTGHFARSSSSSSSPGKGWTLDGVEVEHVHADPTSLDQVDELFASGKTFTTAVVLGTMHHDAAMTPSARDSRVLATLLVLRSVCKARGVVMHCVAENHQDQTSMLALGPPTTLPSKRSRLTFESDFVNTQAIIARCLAMNAAFPQMWDAVSELVSSVPNTPEVEFIEPFHLGILGKSVSFGAVQHLMAHAYGGCGVAIGVARKSDIIMQPRLGEVFEWNCHHRVIIIARR